MPTNDNFHVAKFKAKAKTLHRAVKRGDKAAITRIRPYFSEWKDFSLSQAQLVVAREMRTKSWRELTTKGDWANCSFCRKWQYELSQLIAGPDGVIICEECVERCNGIIENQQAS